MVQATIDPWAEEVPGVDRLVTADELLAWPEDPQFPWQYELVAGRLVRMAPTGLEHWDVTMPFLRAVDRFVEARALGLVHSARYRVSRQPAG